MYFYFFSEPDQVKILDVYHKYGSDYHDDLSEHKKEIARTGKYKEFMK